jgi:hypothetical protein
LLLLLLLLLFRLWLVGWLVGWLWIVVVVVCSIQAVNKRGVLPWNEEDERQLGLHAAVLAVGLENLCLIARNRRARCV